MFRCINFDAKNSQKLRLPDFMEEPPKQATDVHNLHMLDRSERYMES